MSTELTYHRRTFFEEVRGSLFGGRMSAAQVRATEVLLDYWEEHYPNFDIRFLAYILATNFHETGARMISVREGFASSDAEARRILRRYPYAQPHPDTGHAYYGRGRVQLTHYSNYVRLGAILGLPLASNPDLALDDEISVRIMVEGMIDGVSGRGDFTRYALDDFFNETADDPVGARKIVNGTDRAALIAGYYHGFLAALRSAREVARRERERLVQVRQEAQQQVAAGVQPETAVAIVEEAEENSARAMRASPKPDKPSLTKDRITWGTILGGAGAAAPILSSIGSVLDNPWAVVGLGLILVAALLILTGRIKIAKEWGI